MIHRALAARVEARAWVRPVVATGREAAVIREFREFIARGNLVDLAVAVILAIAFAGVVDALSNVILSVIGAAFGAKLTFERLKLFIGETPIPYGAFLTALLNFVIVAFALFLIVKAYNRFRDKPDATTRSCPECTMQIPKAARRCPDCTSQVTPVV
jgi:large conductance mechanosensitive channel